MAATFKSLDAGDVASRDADWNLVRDRITLRALAILTVIVFIPGIIVLAVRWNDPLLGMHSFRQTQTAITNALPGQGNLIFSYYVGVDEMGHAYGGASSQYGLGHSQLFLRFFQSEQNLRMSHGKQTLCQPRLHLLV